MIHVYASRRHYFDHLQPIWSALPDELRGRIMSARSSDPWRTDPLSSVGPDDYVMVASYVDSQKWARLKGRVIYLEHGAGQSYDGDPTTVGNGSYSGGDGHAHTGLFLSPSERVAERWRSRYPHIRAVAVGCPRLDEWGAEAPRRLDGRQRSVVITFHWDNLMCPESRSAFHHYRKDLPAIVDELHRAGYLVQGHAHPRIQATVGEMWDKLGVTFIRSVDDALHADVFVADNTSAMYEAAALGTPVVALNAEWYRRDVEHGLRFWSHVPGVQVDEPVDVLDAVLTAGQYEQERVRAVAEAYLAVDGQASARAVAAIKETISGQSVRAEAGTPS